MPVRSSAISSHVKTMDNAKTIKNRLLNRQIYVQRKNLVQICRW